MILFTGHMKKLVYETPAESEEDLLAQILAAAVIIEHTQVLVEHLYENMCHMYVCATNTRIAMCNHT